VIFNLHRGKANRVGNAALLDSILTDLKYHIPDVLPIDIVVVRKDRGQVFILDIYYRRESGVSQPSRRVAQKIEKDKKLIKKIDKTKKKLIVSRMKT